MMENNNDNIDDDNNNNNISFDKNLFFVLDGLMINWDYWTLENMTQTSLPQSSQIFMKTAAEEAHQRLMVMGKLKFINLYSLFFDFYVFPEVIEKALELHFSGYSTEASSIFLPYLEHTIGDLLCANIGSVGVESGIKWGEHQDPCPSRITEILEDNNVSSLLGPDLVYVLKLLIGPMTGFNLRNLVWHGFIFPEEFPKNFLSLIFAVCVSLPNLAVQNWKHAKYGHTFVGVPNKARKWWDVDSLTKASTNGHLLDLPETNSLELEYYEAVFSQIKYHYRIRSNLSRSILKIQCSFSPLDIQNKSEKEWEEINKIILSSGFPLVGQMQQWIRCIQYFKNKNYFCFMMVGIPMLEHSLRRAFACENDSTERLISADPSSLMTIMDIIISYKLEQGVTNRLILILGDKLTSILWDLFIWGDGCMIRDFLAHGTVSPENIPPQFADQVFVVIIYLMSKFSCHENYYNNSVVKTCTNYVDNFIPNFHPKNILIHSIKNLHQSLLSFYLLADSCKKAEWPKPIPKTTKNSNDEDGNILENEKEEEDNKNGDNDNNEENSNYSNGNNSNNDNNENNNENNENNNNDNTNGVSNDNKDGPSRCFIRTSFYLHQLQLQSVSLSTSLLFSSSPLNTNDLTAFQPEFSLWCPKCIQQFVENLISTCAQVNSLITAVTEEHQKLKDLVMARKAWKGQREMYARLKKTIEVFPVMVHLIMVIVELFFFKADLLQKTFVTCPTDDLPQYH